MTQNYTKCSALTSLSPFNFEEKKKTVTQVKSLLKIAFLVRKEIIPKVTEMVSEVSGLSLSFLVYAKYNWEKIMGRGCQRPKQ